jgi:hypothetical protein
MSKADRCVVVVVVVEERQEKDIKLLTPLPKFGVSTVWL